MAASQPNRFDQNLELNEPARPEATGGSATTGTKAPIIPIESAEIERVLEPSASFRSTRSVHRKFAILGLDLIIMGAAIALLPIGALVLVRINNALPRSLQRSSIITAASVQSRARPVPTAQDKTVSLSEGSVVRKADHTGVVSDVRYTSDASSAVVFVNVDQDTPFEVHRLSSPDRIYLDLQNTKLAPILVGKEIQTEDRLLRALRVGEHERRTTRITLATAQACDYSVKRVQNPSQLRIELRKTEAQSRHDKSTTVATQ